MPRYHINPDSGNPNRCEATISCPYGDINDEHWNSKAEALKARPKTVKPVDTAADDEAIKKLIEAISSHPNPWDQLDDEGGKTYLPRGLRNSEEDENPWRRPIYRATWDGDKPQRSIIQRISETVAEEKSLGAAHVFEGELDRMAFEASGLR